MLWGSELLFWEWASCNSVVNIIGKNYTSMEQYKSFFPSANPQAVQWADQRYLFIPQVRLLTCETHLAPEPSFQKRVCQESQVTVRCWTVHGNKLFSHWCEPRTCPYMLAAVDWVNLVRRAIFQVGWVSMVSVWIGLPISLQALERTQVWGQPRCYLGSEPNQLIPHWCRSVPETQGLRVCLKPWKK